MKRRCFFIPFYLFIILALCVVLSPRVHAQEPVARVFELKYMLVEEAEALLKPLLSPQGRISSFKGTNSLIVKDTPAVLGEIETILNEFDVRPKQVRIKVRYVDEKDVKNLGLDIRWGYRGSHWSVGNLVLPGGGEGVNIEVRVIQEAGATLRGGESSVLVMSGKTGRIAVGRSIPYEEWFFWYSRHYGYYERNVRFKNVNTGFLVEPRVKGAGIDITIVPEVAYSTERDSGTIEYRQLATTLEVKDGQSVVLGGSSEDSDAAVSRFLGGGDRTAEKSSFYMVLTATVE